MKHFGKAFIISILLLPASVITFYLGYHVLGAFILWLVFFLNCMEVKAYASPYQLTNFRVHTLMLGYMTDVITSQPYYLFTISMFALSFAGVLRLESFKKWGLTNYYWTEITGLLATYGIYFFANLQHPADWRGWVLPIFPMLFMSYIASGIIRYAINNTKKPRSINAKAGQQALDFTLPDAEGVNVSLSDFKNRNHVLLLFVRGDWCPSCHIMIRTYEKSREKFAAKEVVTLGISPDNSNVNAEMINRLGLRNILLTDSSQEVTKKYGGQFFANNAETKYPEGIPLPASVLVDKSGVIRYVSTPGRANEFLDPSHIFPIIEQLN